MLIFQQTCEVTLTSARAIANATARFELVPDPSNASSNVFSSVCKCEKSPNSNRNIARLVPLSLMPGPAGTESRWLPTTMTFVLSPVRVVAITLAVAQLVCVPLTTIATDGGGCAANSAAPTLVTTASIGIGVSESPRDLPLIRRGRSFGDFITSTTPCAPAAPANVATVCTEHQAGSVDSALCTSAIVMFAP